MSTQSEYVVLSQNIRSICKNFESFLATVQTYFVQPDFICLTEVWVNEEEVSVYQMDNYKMFAVCNNSYRSGGVIVYVHSRCISSQIDVLFKTADCVCVNVLVFGNSFTFLCIYRQHRFAVSEFLDELNLCLERLNCRNLWVLGDINIDILNKRQSAQYDLLMAEYELESLIREPTRIGPNSATCIDHIYYRCSNMRVCNMI